MLRVSNRNKSYFIHHYLLSNWYQSKVQMTTKTSNISFQGRGEGRGQGENDERSNNKNNYTRGRGRGRGRGGRSNRYNVNCYNCGKYGHYASEFYSEKKVEENANFVAKEEVENNDVVLLANKENGPEK
jgi:Zinc knuckle